MKDIHQTLQFGYTYHLYNRGANKYDVFFEKRNYYYFLEKYFKYIDPIATTYAYCLMKNHFHVLVKIRTYEEITTINSAKTSKLTEDKIRVFPSQQFSNFLNSYTKTLNKSYDRSGTLWERRLNRKVVGDSVYFKRLIAYIHLNPELHCIIDDFKKYKHSSYWSILNDEDDFIPNCKIMNFFGGKEEFIKYHQEFLRNRKGMRDEF